MIIDLPFEDEVVPSDLAQLGSAIGDEVVHASESLAPRHRLDFLRELGRKIVAAEVELGSNIHDV